MLLTLPGAARAADVAFFPVESVTVGERDAAAIGELLAQSYASISRKAVLAPSHFEGSGGSYPEMAAQLGVAEYVRTNAVSLGERIILHCTRYRANGEVIYQEKLTAERIDDMIAVSDRMARALYGRVDDVAARTRHNVIESEARTPTRVGSEKIIGFKTGVHQPFAKSADYAASISAAFAMRLELDRYFIEFGAGFMVPTRARSYDGDYCYYDETCDDSADNEGTIGGLTAEIGASYFLTDSSIAPYVGGGVIPRLVVSGEELAQLSPYLQLGVMLPRDSSTRLYADARLAQGLVKQSLDNDDRVLPTEVSLHVGVGW